MTNLIVLFSRQDEALGVRSLFVRNGYDVASVCVLGSQALLAAQELESGIIICGHKYPDMIYTDLRDELPAAFEMLLVAPAGIITEKEDTNIVTVMMPVKAGALVATLGMMVSERESRRKKKGPVVRSDKEKAIINEAKALLMDRNNMTESEAHRYMQKLSMGNGTGLTETAQMILTLMDEHWR